MRNPGLDETQAGTEITRRNINNLRYADDMCRKRNYRASFIKKVKEEREKPGLNLNIQKTKIMASGPITSWQIEGGKVEAVTGFIFLGSKITVDGDCSHELRRWLLLGRKTLTNLDSVLKS